MAPRCVHPVVKMLAVCSRCSFAESFHSMMLRTVFLLATSCGSHPRQSSSRSRNASCRSKPDCTLTEQRCHHGLTRSRSAVCRKCTLLWRTLPTSSTAKTFKPVTASLYNLARLTLQKPQALQVQLSMPRHPTGEMGIDYVATCIYTQLFVGPKATSPSRL